jgi:hypothetical protein
MRTALRSVGFQQFFLEGLDIDNPSSYKLHDDVKLEYTKGNRRGDSSLDIYCKLRNDGHEIEMGFEIKTPSKNAEEKQLENHLCTIGLKKRESWNPTRKNPKKKKILFVISSGHTEDDAVKKIRLKYRSYRDSLIWFSWHDIRSFIDMSTKTEYIGLKNDLARCGVIPDTTSFKSHRPALKQMLVKWEKGIEKVEKEMETVEQSLDSLDSIMASKNYAIKSSTKSPRLGKAYSFSKSFEQTRVNRFQYREYISTQKEEKTFSVIFGMNLLDGKWYGSFVPSTHNQEIVSKVTSIVDDKSNKTSKIYRSKVWTYATSAKVQHYPGWEFKTNRTPKAVAEFLDKMLNSILR